MHMSRETARVAIVTGAAQGIGKAIALRLADDGFDVVVNDIPAKAKELDVVVQDIIAKKQRGLAVVGDVSQESNVENLVNTTVTQMGGLDVMVANAGIARMAPLTSTPVDEWDLIQAVNVRSMFMCYKAAAIQMIKQGRGGRIIGACSIAGKLGSAASSAYCASKFAVRGLTQSAAAELGEHGITVNAYAPGVVITPMWNDIHETRAKHGLDKVSEAAFPNVGAEDVAGLVSYFAKDESKFITGQAVNINGGIHYD